MKQKIWAYLIHLGTNMWGDPGSINDFHPFSDTMLTEDGVWRQVVDFLPAQGINTIVIDLGDAVQYESHPEIAIKGAWAKDKLKKELDHMREIGLTPIPKLNFSGCHDAWLKDYSKMISTPIYYQVVEDLLKEVVELFDYPEYFHLGLDEETYTMQYRQAYCCIRQFDLWWHDLYFYFNVLEKMGVCPWVWSDYIWNHTEEYVTKMPKSVLQSNWAYNRIKRDENGTPIGYYKGYLDLEEYGFNQVPTCSTFEFCNNQKDTMELAKKYITPDRLYGFMTAPWLFCREGELYFLLNDAYAFGYAKKIVYPDW